MSVYKRGKVFSMNIMVNGVRIAKSTGKTTKREAVQFAAMERQKALDDVKLTPIERAAKLPFFEAVDICYEARWKHCKDSKRALGRAKNLAKLVGNKQLGEVTESVVAEIVLKLDKKNVTSSTVNRFFAALKTLLRHHKQPWDFIKLRKERKGRIRTVSRDEENQVLKLLRETKHSKRRYFYPDVADLVEVLVDTGMRLSELLNLRYDDINYETNLLTIWINKGDRPRSIPLTARVKRILAQRQQDDTEQPFKLNPYQAEHAWRWVRKEMGLENESEFLLHSLRHTCASRLVNKGIDLYVVKEWLGHSTIQVTEKYAHLSPIKLAQAASALEDQ
jgi:integrase